MREQSVTFAANQPRDLTRLIAALSSFPKELALRVAWGETIKSRSDAQNAALHGVAYPALMEFTGHTDPELHQIFLKGYFGAKTVTEFGVSIEVPNRTTTTDEQGRKRKLSTKEFADFYAFIQAKGAEIGCWVPDPDPRYRELKEMREATT